MKKQSFHLFIACSPNIRLKLIFSSKLEMTAYVTIFTAIYAFSLTQSRGICIVKWPINFFRCLLRPIDFLVILTKEKFYPNWHCDTVFAKRPTPPCDVTATSSDMEELARCRDRTWFNFCIDGQNYIVKILFADFKAQWTLQFS